jgi:hypothetical protein
VPWIFFENITTWWYGVTNRTKLAENCSEREKKKWNALQTYLSLSAWINKIDLISSYGETVGESKLHIFLNDIVNRQ